MTDFCSLLRRLATDFQESEWLEFNVSNESHEEIGEYMSALANGAMLCGVERGFLVFGVNDSREMVGTRVRLQSRKVGNESLINWLSRMLSPSPLLNIQDFECDGKSYSIVEIQPPYGRPVKFKGNTFVRIGQHKKKAADHPELESRLWKLAVQKDFESGYAQSDVNIDSLFSILDVNALFERLKTPLPMSKVEIANLLADLGLVVRALEGSFHITNLGAILLARDIKKFPALFAKPVRFIRYVGNDKTDTIVDIWDTRGYAICFYSVLKRIVSELPIYEVFEGGIRHNVSQYPFKALREVFANSLIHQDFTMSGSGPVVEIYNGRIEFTNPGGSLVETNRILDRSATRNRRMAEVMHRLGLCEIRGVGLDMAIQEIEATHLPAPEFLSSGDSMNVVLYGPEDYSKMSKMDRVRACYHHCVIRWAKRDYMSNASLRQRFGLPKSKYVAVSHIIKDCIDAGQIAPAKANQAKRNAKYIPAWAA